jgi:transposase
MEKVQHIIGADLSKKTIDLFCHLIKKYIRIDNRLSGYKELLKWIQQHQINASELMIVMEHTGLYSFCFEQFLQQHQISFTKVNALAIKRSIGLVRGKSDKIDARRIAEYGYEKRSKLIAEVPTSSELQRLRLLHSTRERLVKQRASLLNVLKEYGNIGLSKRDSIMRSQIRIIQSLEKEISKMEVEMNDIIKSNPSLQQNHQLLQSIKGVGKVLATAAIIKTKNFTRFTNARKFACFCGTAPFEYTSGTSIKGKTRVSHLADKHMKTLLDLSAKTAIQHDKELREYYLRRTADGKSKMSTINIVRNKILYRMFAVIKRQTPFSESYLHAA